MRTTMQWTDTSYPAIRRVMGPERENMDDDELEDLIGELFPEADPGDVEDFMRTVQTFGKQVAPLAQRAMPGVIQGAATGATVAGPWGALAGAVGGGAASLLGGGGSPTAPRAQPPAQPASQPAPRPAVSPPPEPGAPVPVPAPAAGAAGAAPIAGAAAAVQQLMALLSRRETLEALLAMLMAGSGRATVKVGSQAVPAAAFANAISELAEQAAEYAATPPSADSGRYLLDAAGNPRGDIANPAERASLLVADIASVAMREVTEGSEALDDFGGTEWSPSDEPVEESDPLDSYEAALEGRRSYG